MLRQELWLKFLYWRSNNNSNEIELFSIPIWIGNIDSSRIKIQDKNIGESFKSKIRTSIHGQNIIDEDSLIIYMR